MKRILMTGLVALIAAVPCAWAQAAHSHDHAAPAVGKAATEMAATGEVKRINSATKKVTIAHGPLKAFDMPAMTMAFSVKDATQLAKIKPGDKVNFSLEKAGEDLVITRIEAVR
jgi:Cu/Ag efflux protein CusF